MTSRDRPEDGAVAIFVAVLAVVLLGCAALTVDLGNAWARKRDIQTQADVAAIAAANWAKDSGFLPAESSTERSQIRGKVAQYMLEAGNVPLGQGATDVATLSSRLSNASYSDGEVLFAVDGESFEVITPEATVEFGLASILGQSEVDVQASASVGLFSNIPGQDVLPFLLPDGCAFGPVDADTTNGGGGGNPSDTPGDGGGTGSGVRTTGQQNYSASLAPASVAQGESVTLTVTIPAPTGLNKTKTPELLFETDASPTWKWDVQGTWTNTGGSSNWTFTADVNPANVTAVAGAWRVQAKVQNDHSTIGSFTVAPGDGSGDEDGPADLSCTGSDRGNFGQLDSPRDGMESQGDHQRRFALNIAVGLDHILEPYEDAPADNCESPTLLEDAQLDDAATDGNNCILNDTGNDGPWIYQGLIAGIDGEKGRLDANRGQTRDGCNGGNAQIGSTPINNDLLSCYLEDGYSLASLAASSGVTTEMLDQSVVDSPRFVWMPVVYANDRSIKDFQPLKTFVPGFITDETSGTNVAGTSDASPDNGVQVNGNSVKKIQVFTFNPDALSIEERDPYVDFNPVHGRERMLLIE